MLGILQIFFFFCNLQRKKEYKNTHSFFCASAAHIFHRQPNKLGMQHPQRLKQLQKQLKQNQNKILVPVANSWNVTVKWHRRRKSVCTVIGREVVWVLFSLKWLCLTWKRMDKETAQTLSLESVDPIPAWLKLKITAYFSYSKIRAYDLLKAWLIK